MPEIRTETAFTRLVGCLLPIQSAPMVGVVQDATLPLAVAAAGGHGMFPATFLPSAYVAGVLDELNGCTRAYGVNLISLMLDPEVLELVAERAPLVDLFFGDPDPKIVDVIHTGGALASWQVVSREEALAAVDAGCDLLVVQGCEAGGHPRGDVGLLPLLEEILDAVDIPVVAAGGIGGPRAVAAALAAGASAVRAGTRFIAAAESAAHFAWKQALTAARPGDAVLTGAFHVGDPAQTTQRVLRASLEAATAYEGDIVGEVALGGQLVSVPRFGSIPPTVGSTGHVEAMCLYAGQSVGGVTGISPAAEIIADLASRLRADTTGGVDRAGSAGQDSRYA